MPLCPDHALGLRCFLIRLLMIVGKEFTSAMAYETFVFQNIQMGITTVYFFFFTQQMCYTTHPCETSVSTGRGCK